MESRTLLAHALIAVIVLIAVAWIVVGVRRYRAETRFSKPTRIRKRRRHDAGDS